VEERKGWLGLPRRRTLLVAALLTLTVALAASSSFRDAPTFDEPIYITAGYHYLRDGNFTLNLEHPPLIKEILALPLACMDLNRSTPPIGYFQTQNAYAHDFMFWMGNSPGMLLQLSRIPAYAMLVALGLLIYFWGKRIFGYRAALASLFCFALTPVFLGDGKLAILDLGATLFMTAALTSFYLLLQGWSRRRFLGCVLLTAAALLSRFNALVLMLLFPLLALARPSFEPRLEGRNWWAVSRTLLGRCILVLLASFLLVLTFYGMHTSRLTRDQQELNISANLKPNSPLVDPLLKVNKVSPPLSHYLLGMAHNYEYMQVNHISYWNGYFSRQWRWYYYPWIFLLKTPLAVILLFLAGLAVCLSRFRRWSSAFLIICLAILALASEASKIQLGVRYIMPIFPFVLLLAGRGAAALLETRSGRRARAALLAALLAWAMASVLLFTPSFLSYSNELILDKDNAYKWLIDSNLDWGQDLQRLADFVDENGIEDLEIDYFGGGEPLYYLPAAREWCVEMAEWDPRRYERPHGWFAVSLTRRQLSFWELEPRDDLSSPYGYKNWLMGYDPVYMIGDSILLYYLK